MIITIGKVQFNPEALDSYTKDEFKEVFKGKVDMDIALKMLSKYFKKADVSSNKKSSKKNKETKSESTL